MSGKRCGLFPKTHLRLEPRSAQCAHLLAWCTWNRWDSSSRLISWKAMSEFLFSQLLASTSASASANLCWVILSLRTAESTFSSRIFWRFSFNECTTFWSRSLFPFVCVLKVVGTTDSVSHICTSFLDARTTVNRPMISPLLPEAST